MSEPTRFAGRDWLVAGLVVGVGLALRLPFRSQLAYHWDSAQFALAIGHYDLSAGQPHAPGYFLYVLAGRLLNCLVGDPHASLVWLSVVAGAILPALGYLLGAAMFGRGCGLASAAILLTSPLCWFHSEIALSTTVDSVLVTTTILGCWLAIQRGGSRGAVLGLGLLLAVVAGTRPQTAVMLAPAWVYTFFRLQPPRGAKLALGMVVSGVLCWLWLIPLVQTAGGWEGYGQLLWLKAGYDRPKTAWGGGAAAAWNSLLVIVSSGWVGLLAAAVGAVVGWLRWTRTNDQAARQEFYRRHREQGGLLALWILPMVALGVAVYTTMPGYVLAYFPALAVLAALGLTLPGRRPILRTAAVGTAALTNALIFLWAPGAVEPLLLGLPLTAPEIRRHDRQLAECFALIRHRFSPNDLIICHGGEFFFWGFRQFEYYLPEYRNVLLTHDGSLPGRRGRQFWVGRATRTEFIEALAVKPTDTVLLVVPPGESPELFRRHFDIRNARPVAGASGILYILGGARPIP